MLSERLEWMRSSTSVCPSETLNTHITLQCDVIRSSWASESGVTVKHQCWGTHTPITARLSLTHIRNNEGTQFSWTHWNNWVCSWGSVWRGRINMCLFELKVCVCVCVRLAGRLSLFYWRKNIHVFRLRSKPWESDEALCHIFQYW